MTIMKQNLIKKFDTKNSRLSYNAIKLINLSLKIISNIVILLSLNVK